MFYTSIIRVRLVRVINILNCQRSKMEREKIKYIKILNIGDNQCFKGDLV